MKALQEEKEKLRESIEELEQSVTRLQRQIADVKGDEAKAKEMLKECEVRLAGPQPRSGSRGPFFFPASVVLEAEGDLLS